MEKMLKATHEGKIQLGENELNVAVLEDGTRVITQSAVFKAFGRTKRGRMKDDVRVPNMPAFIDANNVQPYINQDLKDLLNVIVYTSINGNESSGYDANILPLMCKMYLDARQDKVLKTAQMPLARASEILLVGLSKLGITALVDEATGYQYDRERFELQKILTSYISEEILRWQLTFTDDFYKQVFRLWGLPFIPKYVKNKPSFIGNLTIKYIYDQLPTGVLDKIREKTGKTAKGNWKYQWHRNLTEEVGREHLKKQIIEVTLLMEISKDKKAFEKLFKEKYQKSAQISLFDEDLNINPDLLPEIQQNLSDFNKKLKKAGNYNPNKS
jgi:hypothetical protein